MTPDAVTGPEPDYRAILAELTALDDRAATHRAEAQRWFADRAAVADEAERAAEEAVRQAVRTVRQAQRDREEVDARAAGLWSDFVHRVGPAAERFGRTVPEAVLPRQRGDRGPHDYLQEVATRVAYTPPARPLTGLHKVLFALAGAVGGALGYALAHVVRMTGERAGGDWAVALPVVALIVMLLGPLLGIAGARQISDRRGVALDAAAVAVVLIAGTATNWLLHLALR
jgi:hypothetical protein